MMSDPSIPFFWILIKKRIILYQYMQGQFIQFSEIPLNDTPLVVNWFEDDVALQYKDRIDYINIHTTQQIASLKTQVKNGNQMAMKLLQNQSILVASANTTYSFVVKDDSGVHFGEPSIQLTSAVKQVCYVAPFIFILTDSLQVFDEYSGTQVTSIPLSSPLQLICDVPFTLSELKEEIYSMLLGVTADGSLVSIDLKDSDAYVTELMNTNRMMPAFAILHRNEKIQNTLMNQGEFHQKAFIFFFTQAKFAEAFHHAFIANVHPSEFLPLFSDLLSEEVPPPAVLTKEVIGRNNHTMIEFVVSALKQQSYDPSSITAESEEVAKSY